jgi:hypothetical protein
MLAAGIGDAKRMIALRGTLTHVIYASWVSRARQAGGATARIARSVPRSPLRRSSRASHSEVFNPVRVRSRATYDTLHPCRGKTSRGDR